MALMPQNNLGITVSDTPTLFFIFLKLKQNSTITLMDNEGNELLEKAIALPEKPGVMKLNISVKLEENKLYRWELP
jgi:hypothetical protein